MKNETLAEEKARMIKDYDYYRKANGEVDCVMNTRNLTFHYGAAAVFILGYMRMVHKCSLLPIRD